jgi:hypothetical protein
MHDSILHRAIVDELQAKIKTLHDTTWNRHGDWPQVLTWLTQFRSDADVAKDEQIQALYLLSNFLYFGDSEIRALLRSLFRDVFRPVLAQTVRSNHGGTRGQGLLAPLIEEEIAQTRFVALGNPSESSAMLLYYFRQENGLSKDLFVDRADLFNGFDAVSNEPLGLKLPNVRHYVFIDDLCGSGRQGVEYSTDMARPLRALSKKAQTYYYALFGLRDGINHIRKHGHFDSVYPVVEIDESFRAFADASRFYEGCGPHFQKVNGKAACERHGGALWTDHPLGYEDGQLLLGFHHNTPDNTLPIFWADENMGTSWTPIFKRFPKVA